MRKLLLILSIFAMSSISGFAQDIEDMSSDKSTTSVNNSSTKYAIVRSKEEEKNGWQRIGYLFRIGVARPLQSHYAFDPVNNLYLNVEMKTHQGRKTPSSVGGTGKWGLGFGFTYSRIAWQRNENYVEAVHRHHNKSYESIAGYMHVHYYLNQRFYLNGGFGGDGIFRDIDDSSTTHGSFSLQAGINYSHKSGFTCGLGYNLPVRKYGMQSLNLSVGWFFNE